MKTTPFRSVRRYLRRTLPLTAPALLVAGLTVAYVAHADVSTPVVPTLLGVQGYVTDSGGTPITGSQNVTLALYTTDVGGNAIFSESQQVTFQNGIIATQLGRNTKLDPTTVVYPNPQLFLGVTIGGASELQPRIRIASTTYAIQAQHAAQADTATNGVPAGTITAFGGSTAPAGWLLCDGSIIDPVAQPQYVALQGTLAEGWGDGGDGAQPKFNLPDLRGLFLRGVDGSAGRDKDVAVRTAPAHGTGNVGDAVGSMEGESFLLHNHSLNDPGHSHTFNLWQDGCAGGGEVPPGQIHTCPSWTYATSSNTTGITMNGSGGSETRPINAAVNYIIKY